MLGRFCTGRFHHLILENRTCFCRLSAKVGLRFAADLVVFSAEEIGTKSNYVEPNHGPEGIEHVLINGTWSIRDGHLEGRIGGQPLRA